MAVEFGMDFSPIGKLGEIYQQAQQRQQLEQGLQKMGLPANMGLAQLALQQQAVQRAQGNADRSFGLERESLDLRKTTARAAENEPKLYDIFVDGQPQKATYDPAKAGDPLTRGFTPVGGAKSKEAPAGYKWKDPKNPEAGLAAIPGGPGEKVDAEVAARLGLAKSFLGQLEDTKDANGNVVKGIRTRVKEGELTGIWDGAMGAANIGGAGELRRRIESGSEALLRNLTGAGMNKDEAKKYVRRYEPELNDKSETIISKLDQLERELRSVDSVISQGRGGSILDKTAAPAPGAIVPPPAPPPAPAPPKVASWKNGETIKAARADVQGTLADARAKIAAGADPAAVAQRLKMIGIDPAGLAAPAAGGPGQGSAGAIY